MVNTKLIPYDVTQININRLPDMPVRRLPWYIRGGQRQVLNSIGRHIYQLIPLTGYDRWIVSYVIPGAGFGCISDFMDLLDTGVNSNPWWTSQHTASTIRTVRR